MMYNMTEGEELGAQKYKTISTVAFELLLVVELNLDAVLESKVKCTIGLE